MEIRNEQLKNFEYIKKQFLPKTKIPRKNNWKNKMNNDIWLDIVRQVIVVGSSKGVERLEKRTEFMSQISYEKLVQIKNEDELKKRINEVLRAVGTRYASSDISKCKKTNAIVHNLKVLKNFKDGPRELLKKLSGFRGNNTDKRKIKYIMKIFQYMKSKGSRDFLMELGLVENAIALDVRIQNIFNKIDIKLPKGFETKQKLYDDIEKDILSKICKPLKLLGVEFDRMLYQNYENIKKIKF